MRYNTILFDLDGTISDTAEGVANSILYALNKMGIEKPSRKKLLLCIGPPLIDSFCSVFGLTEHDAQRAIGYYREYYADKGIFECHLYPGIPELLMALKMEGATIALATSKPEVYAERILRHYSIFSLFDYVGGSQLNGQRTKKSEVIAYVLSTLPEGGRNSALMVGDRKYDVEGAKEIGIPCAGVLFGYGSKEELAKAGAIYLADSTQELLNWINENSV